MVTQLHVRAINQKTSHARLSIGQLTFPCLVGRTGLAHLKREGDGKTPIGVWRVHPGFCRTDQVRRPLGGPATRPMRRNDGWCDAKSSQHYNRWVRLPFSGSHEALWMENTAYAVVFPTSHNERPRILGGGSAIFFHLIHEGATCTAGCVAVRPADMRKILALCSKKLELVIWP